MLCLFIYFSPLARTANRSNGWKYIFMWCDMPRKEVYVPEAIKWSNFTLGKSNRFYLCASLHLRISKCVPDRFFNSLIPASRSRVFLLIHGFRTRNWSYRTDTSSYFIYFNSQYANTSVTSMKGLILWRGKRLGNIAKCIN